MSHHTNIRLSSEDKRIADRITEEKGISLTELVRQMLKTADQAQQTEAITMTLKSVQVTLKTIGQNNINNAEIMKALQAVQATMGLYKQAVVNTAYCRTVLEVMSESSAHKDKVTARWTETKKQLGI
jgi:Rod binding domain-containing protein